MRFRVVTVGLAVLAIGGVCGAVATNALQASAKPTGCPTTAKLLRSGGALTDVCLGHLVRNMLLDQQRDEATLAGLNGQSSGFKSALIIVNGQISALKTLVQNVQSEIQLGMPGQFPSMTQLFRDIDETQSRVAQICAAGQVVSGFTNSSPTAATAQYVRC